MTEMVIQQLLTDAGARDVDQDLVMVEPKGLEVAADWRTLRSPETYLGYRQSTGFAQDDVARFDAPTRTPPRRGCLSTRGPSPGTGPSRRTPRYSTEPAAGSRSSSRRAMSTSSWVRRRRARRSRSGCSSTAQHRGTRSGATSTPDGSGTVTDQRTYQLIRQTGPIEERRFEIEFLEAGAEAYCFTFG